MFRFGAEQSVSKVIAKVENLTLSLGYRLSVCHALINLALSV